MPNHHPQIKANLTHVRERMMRAAARAGRDPSEITLVAVTKTHPWVYVDFGARCRIARFRRAPV